MLHLESSTSLSRVDETANPRGPRTRARARACRSGLNCREIFQKRPPFSNERTHLGGLTSRILA